MQRASKVGSAENRVSPSSQLGGFRAAPGGARAIPDQITRAPAGTQLLLCGDFGIAHMFGMTTNSLVGHIPAEGSATCASDATM